MNILNYKKRIYTAFLLLFLIFIIYKIKLIFAYTLLILGVVAIIEFLTITKKFIKKKQKLYLINLFFLVYISFFLICAFAFYNNYQTKIIIFILLVCCAASDMGGFVFGKIFRGPKLTKISPNKTISGAVGSLISSSFVILIIFNILEIELNSRIIMIGIITSLGCQAGDLIFSYLKRKAKLKDTGNFFPGHGGVLDRLDGILLGIPIGFFTIIYFY